MDEIFEEEQKKLDEVERRLDKVATQYEEKCKDLQFRIDNFICVDYDDRDRLKDLRYEFRKSNDSAEQFRNYQPSPYFGRIDMDCLDDETSDSVFYIGKEGISIGSDIIVIDWRAPIGTCFYAFPQTDYKVEGLQYKLMLRRELDIRNKVLVNCTTTYDDSSLTLEGDIIDPFLITVLKDKRRQHRLTDIIRTIQSNQNEIIRKDRNQSFIVQGCAGSGKTMILLHRLSYLLFNNRDLNVSTIKIITPNRFFNAHINDLSEKLGLSSIDRYSVEEYYAYLIKQFSRGITIDPNVHSEKSLKKDLLETIYSVDYYDKTITDYHKYWDQVLKTLGMERLSGLFEVFGIRFPDISVHKYMTADMLESGVTQISSKIRTDNKTENELKSRARSVQAQINSAKVQLETEIEQLESIKDNTVNQIGQQISSLKESVAKREENASVLQQQLTELQNKSTVVEGEIKQLSDVIEALDEKSSNYTDYDLLINNQDSVSIQVRKSLTELFAAVGSTINEYNRTPIYNIGKRNDLRRRISEGKELVAQSAEQVLDAYRKQINDRIRIHSVEQKTSAAIIADTTRRIDEAMGVISEAKTQLAHLSTCIQLFESEQYPSLKSELSSEAYSDCLLYVTDYVNHWESCQQSSLRLRNLTNTQKTIENSLSEAMDKVYSKEDAEYIDKIIPVVKSLQISEILNNVILSNLMDEYEAHDQIYSESSYRHKIYLSLMLCALYYNQLNNPDRFVNIDEAQDISVAEYMLLRSILGERCVFNLYGDVNQAIYEYKGIFDWGSIPGTAKDSIYILNENYRNTLQITDFCNQEFGTDVVPIGITGAGVNELTVDAAIEWIVGFKNSNPESRTSIIYRYGNNAVEEILREKLESSDFISWNEVNDHLLSVISVEDAKGLEFEAVVAIVDKMTDNEKYVSYTRALDNLVVVRDEFHTQDETSIVYSTGSAESPFITFEDNNGEEYTEKALEQYTTDAMGEYENGDNNDPCDSISSDVNTMPSVNSWDDSLIEDCTAILHEAFEDDSRLDDIHKNVLNNLFSNHNVMFKAPSGSMKSVLLFMLTKIEREKGGMQTLLTASAHLQENELIIASKIGLKAGLIGNSISEFRSDFNRDKYDVIFVPSDFFRASKEAGEFVDYFSGKVKYWGFDNPSEYADNWSQFYNCGLALDTTMYIMERERFDYIDTNEFLPFEAQKEYDSGIVKKIQLSSDESKLEWLLTHLGDLNGQGIIYCKDEETCKSIRKSIRKMSVQAETYLNVLDLSDAEQRDYVNYVTNSFSRGGIPVLVTTHPNGKDLSTPYIRFIVHFDEPSSDKEYDMHVYQIGALAQNPIIIDFVG